MRWLMSMISFLGAAMMLQADTYLYVSKAKEQEIQVFRLDAKDGTLTSVDTVKVDGAPGCLVVDPAKKFLFASLRSNSTLASYRIDSARGKFKPINTVPLIKGENAAYVNTDRTGRWLFSASYAAGKIVVHGIGDDGSIKAPPVQIIETVKTAHCAFVDPGNHWVFVPHVTPNAVYQYRLDAKTGKLEEAGKASPGADKAGPRHLTIHADSKLAFSSNEESNTVTSYRFDPESGLKAIDNQSTLPADFKDKNTTAEVKVHPTGKFVWVSNRGHDSLAGFAVDAKSGKLTSLGQTPTELTPRSFDLDPTGRYLFVAGEGSGKLTTYNVDARTGKLTTPRSLDVGKSLTWVLAVELPDK